MKAAKIIAVLAIMYLPFAIPQDVAPVAGGTLNMIVDAPQSFYAGSNASMRVLAFRVVDLYQATPVEGATAAIYLDEQLVFQGKTGKTGSADTMFAVPEIDPKQCKLKVALTHGKDTANMELQASIAKAGKIMLVTDKPVYQPNQTILMRALAMDHINMTAIAGKKITLTVQDPKGNIVFKEAGKTSDYGIFASSFRLADELNLGFYRVVAEGDQITAEKSVEIKKYVLPKFKIELATNEKFYKPMDKVKCTLNTKYFFGKPVADATVRVIAKTFDVQFREFANVSATTDKSGKAEFEVQLPEYFVGQPIEQGNAYVLFETAVTDKADHTEKAEKKVSVSAQTMNVQIIPEGGTVIAGVPIRGYIVVTQPDGSPASVPVDLEFAGKKFKLRTDSAGFGVFDIDVKAEQLLKKNTRVWTKRGWSYGQASLPIKVTVDGKLEKTIELSADDETHYVFVRTDKAVYKQGQNVSVTAFTSSKSDVVFVDLIRERQTLFTTTIDVADGKGDKSFTVPLDVVGAIELHAYRISRAGEIYRDSKLIYVNPANNLKIQVAPDGSTVKPGDTVKLNLKVLDEGGNGTQGALGLIVVDEAVYAMQEMQPGLEKTYFMLQEEYMKPRFQIKNFAPQAYYTEIEDKMQEAARMLLTNIDVKKKTVENNQVIQTWYNESAKIQTVINKVWQYLEEKKKDAASVTNVKADGTREFKDLVQLMLQEGKLKKEEVMLSWGKPVTFKQLQQTNAYMLCENYTAYYSREPIANAYRALRESVRSRDIVVKSGEKLSFKEDIAAATITSNQAPVDCWGDALTGARLMKYSSSFSPENVVALTTDARAEGIWKALLDYAKVGALGDGKNYHADIIARLDKNSGLGVRKFFDPNTGNYFAMDDLVKNYPELSYQNVIAHITAGKAQFIQNSVVAYMKKNDFSKLVDGDKFKPQIIEELLKNNFLKEMDLKGPDGIKMDVNFLNSSYQYAFSVQAITTGLVWDKVNALYAKIMKYCQKTKGCWDVNRNTATPPKTLLEEMIKNGEITEEDTIDMMGRKLKLYADATRNMNSGCGCVMQHVELRAAGADGQFDTADDVRFGYHSSGNIPQIGTSQFYARMTYPVIEQDYDELDDADFSGLVRRNQLKGDTGAPSGGPDQLRKNGRSGGGRPPAPKEEEKKKERQAPSKTAATLKPGADEPAAGEEEEQFAGIDHIREWFPETLYWNPEVVTDAAGNASVEFKVADSITTWRLTAMGNTKSGKLGSTTASVIAFKDFFVDIDFPVSITQNDIFSVPIAIFNYLKEPQKIKIVAERKDWFTLLSDESFTLNIDANGVKVVYFKIKADKVGNQDFTVMAYGTKMSDAIKRTIEVVPDGKMFETVINGTLTDKISHTITIPSNSIEGSFKIFTKIYPTVVAQAADSLDGLLRLPYG